VAIAAGVAHHGSTHATRDSGRELESHQTGGQTPLDETVELDTGPDGDGITVYLEGWNGHLQDEAAETTVVSQYITAITEVNDGQVVFRHSCLELARVIVRLDESDADGRTAGGKRRAAGELLEAVGAKEMRVGGAAVYAKHANIIINANNATCRDVLTLAARMQAAVADRFGVQLEEEVRYLSWR